MDNYIKYIKAGLGLDPSTYNKHCLAIAILVALASCPGIVLGGFWMGLFVVMALLMIGATIFIWIIKSKGLTTKNRLIVQVIIYSAYILQLILLEISVSSSLFGIKPYLFLLLLQPVVVPLIMAYFNDRALKSGDFKSKKGGLVVGGSLFGLAGIIGGSIGKAFFKDISQVTAVILIIGCLSFVVIMLSIGLLSIHRLYYLCQYESKYGPFPD